jgi:hypothetical protein
MTIHDMFMAKLCSLKAAGGVSVMAASCYVK